MTEGTTVRDKQVSCWFYSVRIWTKSMFLFPLQMVEEQVKFSSPVSGFIW